MKAKWTQEMINDLRNFDFYVKKSDNIYPIDNDFIKIESYSNSNKYYQVYVNYILYERLLKISKFTNNEKYNKIIELVKYCESNKVNDFISVLESELVDELSNSINKNIISNIIKMNPLHITKTRKI